MITERTRYTNTFTCFSRRLQGAALGHFHAIAQAGINTQVWLQTEPTAWKKPSLATTAVRGRDRRTQGSGEGWAHCTIEATDGTQVFCLFYCVVLTTQDLGSRWLVTRRVSVFGRVRCDGLQVSFFYRRGPTH